MINPKYTSDGKSGEQMILRLTKNTNQEIYLSTC
jgi:hypothetical protein